MGGLNKQNILLDHARQHDGKITTEEANDLLAHFYYHNHAHYISEILSRLVRSGKLVREKRGHYKLKSDINPSQLELFI